MWSLQKKMVKAAAKLATFGASLSSSSSDGSPKKKKKKGRKD